MENVLNEIDAYIYNHKIGTLILHEGTIYFQYDDEFKGLDLEISPLKLDTKKHSGLYSNKDNKDLYQGMAGVFFDSLPDKYGMVFIDRYFEGTGLRLKEISLLHKLAFMGDRGMGAIEYRPQEHEDSDDLENVMDAKEAYENMKSIIDNKTYSIHGLMNLIDSASPLGGGRPKMLISYNKKINKIKFNNKNLEPGYKRAIIKFDEAYYEDESIELTKLEYLYMTMAQECGIKIPPITLYHEEGKHHFIIERFDRDEGDNKIHICTASGLMHKDISMAKVMSYEELFAFTLKVCKSQVTVEELYRRMVFNALSFNYDDHAKNFTFIMNKNGKWDLSPAYDITYSKGMRREHITTINGKGKDFILEDFLIIAKKQTIKESTARKIIIDISNSLSSFESKAHKVNLNAQYIKECKEDIEHQLGLLQE